MNVCEPLFYACQQVVKEKEREGGGASTIVWHKYFAFEDCACDWIDVARGEPRLNGLPFICESVTCHHRIVCRLAPAGRALESAQKEIRRMERHKGCDEPRI